MSIGTNDESAPHRARYSPEVQETLKRRRLWLSASRHSPERKSLFESFFGALMSLGVLDKKDFFRAIKK